MYTQHNVRVILNLCLSVVRQVNVCQWYLNDIVIDRLIEINEQYNRRGYYYYRLWKTWEWRKKKKMQQTFTSKKNCNKWKHLIIVNRAYVFIKDLNTQWRCNKFWTIYFPVNDIILLSIEMFFSFFFFFWFGKCTRRPYLPT